MSDATGKTLVVYYSYTGNCRSIVNILTNQLKADVLEILPVDKSQRYEANNYAIGTQLLNAIKANTGSASSYPAIDPVNTSLDNYENVIIVTPLWWSQMAAIMQTYLFQNAEEMAGKNVAMIVSSSSSSISGVVADAKRLLPDVVWMGDALHIRDSNRSRVSSLIADWLSGLNFQAASVKTMNITISGKTVAVTLSDNSSAEALYEALLKGPITYEAHDYGNFEKVGELGQSFPRNDEQINTQPGDIILYQGSNLCIYYGTNSWNFTRIGRIEGMTQDELKDFVKAGQGNVSVTLSIGSATAIHEVPASFSSTAEKYISMGGVRVMSPSKGVYIKDGKKVLII
jgi:flavodoxin